LRCGEKCYWKCCQLLLQSAGRLLLVQQTYSEQEAAP
jgi:hypothetical protein